MDNRQQYDDFSDFLKPEPIEYNGDSSQFLTASDDGNSPSSFFDNEMLATSPSAFPPDNSLLSAPSNDSRSLSVHSGDNSPYHSAYSSPYLEASDQFAPAPVTSSPNAQDVVKLEHLTSNFSLLDRPAAHPPAPSGMDEFGLATGTSLSPQVSPSGYSPALSSSSAVSSTGNTPHINVEYAATTTNQAPSPVSGESIATRSTPDSSTSSPGPFYIPQPVTMMPQAPQMAVPQSQHHQQQPQQQHNMGIPLQHQQQAQTYMQAPYAGVPAAQGNDNSAQLLSAPPMRSRQRSQSDPPQVRITQPQGQNGSQSDSNGKSSGASDFLSPDSAETGGRRARSASTSSSKSRSRSRSRSANRDYILELAAPSATNKRVQKHPSAFACNLCDKRFTRAYNLRSHLRTHTDERPFVCTVCGKAFARQHDRKRHEALHSGEKKFECRGVLANGVTVWGCGRKFARADALGRHFRTEAGRECIRPLLEEEAREQAKRQGGGMQQQGQMSQPGVKQEGGGVQGNVPIYVGGQEGNPSLMLSPPSGHGPDSGAGGNFGLPAALLQQFPSLMNTDLSGLSGNISGEDLSDFE